MERPFHKASTAVSHLPRLRPWRARWQGMLASSIALTAVPLSGCQDRSDDSALIAETAPEATEASLPDDPLLREIVLDASRVAPQMVPAEPPFQGRMEAGSKHAILAVLQAGRCFRVFSAAEPSVENLDLVLYDAHDVRIQEKLGAGRRPILGESSSICPPEAGAHRIEVRLTKGAGDVAVQLFRTEP